MPRYSADQIADRAHDYRKHESSPRHQKRAVSELVACCHALIVCGTFGPEIEKLLRARVRTVCLEFDMDPPPSPRPDTRILAAFDGMVPR